MSINLQLVALILDRLTRAIRIFKFGPSRRQRRRRREEPDVSESPLD